MKRALLCGSAALLTSLATFGAGDIKVCEAIPVGDVEAALGVKVLGTQPRHHECQWRTSMQGAFASLKAFKRASHKVSGTGLAEEMKKMGFAATIADDTPELWCAKLVAPANMGGFQQFKCNALAGTHYFEVSLTGADSTREKAKALLAKAAARLP